MYRGGVTIPAVDEDEVGVLDDEMVTNGSEVFMDRVVGFEAHNELVPDDALSEVWTLKNWQRTKLASGAVSQRDLILPSNEATWEPTCNSMPYDFG